MSFLNGRKDETNRLVVRPDEDIWGTDRYESSSTASRTPKEWEDVGSTSSRANRPVDSQRIACGNPECSSSWTKPWKSRRRPIFEGQWGCGSRCLQALIRGAVRRETGDGLAEVDETPHRHRVPLGLLMLAKGWITQPQLRRALEGQRAAGGKIGEWLQQDCGIGRETITRGLSMQWNCPVLTTEGFEPQRMALVMPRLFVEELGLLPLRIAASRLLYLAFEDHLDASSAFSMQKMTELKVESGLVEAEALHQARARLLESQFVGCERVSARDTEQLITKIDEALEERQPVGARLVRLQRFYWLRMWLETGTQGAAGTVPVSVEDVADVVFRVGS